jgi:hypothetical protein
MSQLASRVTGVFIRRKQNLGFLQMNVVMFLFLALLAYLLTPGVLLVLPSKSSSPMVVNATHAVILSLVYAVSHKAVYNMIGKSM